MFVRDHQRPKMHSALGMNATDYDMQVFRITTEISKQVFPVLLDIENPKFLEGLIQIKKLNEKIDALKKVKTPLNFAKRKILNIKVAFIFSKLYLIKPVTNKLPNDLRLRPTW